MTERLKLLAGVRDEKLGQLKYVVHGTANEASAQQIIQLGFRYLEGRPSVSTNLIHALDWTTNPAKHTQSLGAGTQEGEPGRLILLRLQPGPHLGYGVFTSAYIDRRLRRVGGAPLRYAAARKQLAFYQTPQTDQARQRIEDAIMDGRDWSQQTQQMLDSNAVIGTIASSANVAVILGELSAAIADFNRIDIDKFTNYLSNEAEADQTRYEEVKQSLRELVVGTVESVIISRLRMMRWQGLVGIGYSLYEGQDRIDSVTSVLPSEQLRRIEDYERQLASSAMFEGELMWLKPYAISNLAVMRVELEGLS